MQARIWGCRGSLATPGAGRYGGNTPCVEVRPDDGSAIVLDAGTGIRLLGETLAGSSRIDLLLTHLHLDHIEGLGFFAPLHDPDCAVTIWGPPGTRAGVETWLAPPYYPARIAAAVEFREVRDETFRIGDVEVSCAVVPHPSTTLGYRLDGLAYIPDHEARIAPEPAIELARGAGVLLHDAQYTVGECAARAGWGHSSVADFAAVVTAAGAERAVMFHHDPSHDDATLEAMRDEAAALLDRQVEIASEGLLL
jgi:phosphoribosyl 1,2-cyclic phosphodiesterase